MYSRVYAISSLYAFGAQAVSFTSWRGLTCRGQLLVKDQTMYPYTCYSAGLDASAIKATGLENSNNPSTYMEVYADKDCKEYRTTIKYSDTCIDVNFQAVRLFVPAVGSTKLPDIAARNETLEQLRTAPFEDLTLEQQSHFDRELDAALVAMEPDESTFGRLATRQEFRPRLGLSILPVRTVGDRHTSETDSTITGSEVSDDNTPGDSAGFRFANNNERSNWARTVYQRLMDYRRHTPGAQNYTGSQTVGNHDLDLDIDLRSGTFDSTENALLRQWLVMFARQRDNHAHQV